MMSKVIERSCLIANELWFCSIQVARERTGLVLDQSNQEAIDTVRGLLDKNAAGYAGIDSDCDNPNLTRILLFPELAFGSSDWEIIDTLVQNYDKPLIVCAGFGFTKVKNIRDRVSFLENNIGDNRNVNWGCVWIKFPKIDGASEIFEKHFYCKNFPEQRNELTQFNPVALQENLIIEFNDLVFCPFICADLIQRQEQGNRTVTQRIADCYNDIQGKHILIAGSLLQLEPWHSRWQGAIDTLLTNVEGVLVLSNIAHENRPDAFENDSARNLSGVYITRQLYSKKPSAGNWFTSKFGHLVVGQLVRDSISMCVAGKLKVGNHTTATGIQLWWPVWAKKIGQDGLKNFYSKKECYEVPRILARTTHNIQDDARFLNGIKSYLIKCSESKLSKIFALMTNGPFCSDECAEPGDKEVAAALEKCFKSADAMSRLDTYSWPEDGENEAVLIHTLNLGKDSLVELKVIFWSSVNEKWTDMCSSVQEYIDTPSSNVPIILFACDKENKDIPINFLDLSRDSTMPKAEDYEFSVPRSSQTKIAVLDLQDALKISDLVADQENRVKIENLINQSVAQQFHLDKI